MNNGQSIKPIETVYNGYRFRSRLEARWAVFFDAAGIRYEYEPEGFNLGDGIYYLPDFYLPDDDVWVEIKGKALSDEEREKIERFCIAKCDLANGGSKFRLLEGQIPSKLIGVTGVTEDNFCGIPSFAYVSPDEFEKFNVEMGLGFTKKLESGVLLGAIWTPSCGFSKMCHALKVARQARFEHGEKPIF